MSTPGRRSPLLAIFAGGLLAGLLDITAAIVQWSFRKIPPIRILQSVASGLLGKAAYSGGARTAALGLALHLGIATTACAIYFVASRRLRFLRERPWIAGALYGVAVWAFMNFVVLPLSAVAKHPFNPAQAAIQIGIHVACVGWPIALTLQVLTGDHAG